MASDWEQLEQWMEKQQLPKGFDVFRQSDWIDNFVRGLMNKAIPAASSALQPTNANVLETKRHVIVTYPLGESANTGELQLTAKEDRVKLSGLPGGKSETIRLPKLVLPRTCEADYDGVVLKIKLRKRPASKRIHQATIRGLPSEQ